MRSRFMQYAAGWALAASVLVAGGSALAGSFHYGSLEEALTAAGRERKPLLLDFGTSW